jgi:hypothetical protein
MPQRVPARGLARATMWRRQLRRLQQGIGKALRDDGDDGWTSSSGHDLSLTLIDLVRPWAG